MIYGMVYVDMQNTIANLGKCIFGLQKRTIYICRTFFQFFIYHKKGKEYINNLKDSIFKIDLIDIC